MQKLTYGYDRHTQDNSSQRVPVHQLLAVRQQLQDVVTSSSVEHGRIGLSNLITDFILVYKLSILPTGQRFSRDIISRF